MTWTPPDPLNDAQGAAWAPPDPLIGAGTPRTAQGFFETLAANYQASSTGLFLRGAAPDVFANPESPWYERIAGSVVGMIGDAPAMAAGAFAGAAIPLPSQIKPIVSGAGAFAAPAVVREALMSYYTTGEVDYSKLAVTAAKEAAVGAATFWAGGAAAKMLPEATTALGKAGRFGAIGGAEYATLMSARSVVDWRIPEAHEFVDNAVLIFGLRGAREYGVPALMKIYERTGKTPDEVRADAARDSSIAQEVLQGRIPEGYQARTYESRGIPRPDLAPLKELPDPPPATAVERAAYNLRHFNDEASMRAMVESAGADYVATIEAARRGRVSQSETMQHAEQWSAWLQETVGAGKTTRRAGEAANDAQIVGYGRTISAMMEGVRESAAALEAIKAGKDATPEALASARAEHAVRMAQMRALVADYLGAVAESARAVKAVQYVNKAVGDVKELMAAMDKVGYRGWVDHSAKMILEAQTNKQLANFVRRTTAFDKAVEWWKASVLSGPSTQVVNMLSNVAFSAVRVPKTIAAAAVSEARGKDTVMYREAVAEAVGMLAGLPEGVRVFGKTFMREWGKPDESAPTTPESLTKAEIHKVALEGGIGKIMRSVSFVPLEAADAMLKTINSSATAYAAAARASKGDIAQMATREFWSRELGKAKESESVIAQMQADALRYTFQTELSPKAQRIMGALYDTPLAYVLPFFLPFVRTPINIYSEAIRMLPGLAVLSKRARDEWAKGGTARERVVGDQVVGAAIGLSVIALAESGLISGSGPADPTQRRALLERGWKPFSVRVNDEWVSYSRVEPLATIIGSFVDLWQIRKYLTKSEYELAGRAVFVGLREQVTNKTWLLGVTSLLDIVTPDEYGGAKATQAVARVLSGFIPNLVSQTDRALDEHLRDTRGFIDTLQNRVPILRRGLLPKRDSFGQPITQDELFPFSGIQVSAEKGDPVRDEMARVGYAPAPIRTTELDLAPGPVTGKYELSDEQLDSFRTRAGSIAYKALGQIFQTEGYKNAPLDYKRSMIEQTFSAARQHAKFGVIPASAIQEATQKALREAATKK